MNPACPGGQSVAGPVRTGDVGPRMNQRTHNQRTNNPAVRES